MEPQLRFCTSADGTRIAYIVYGSGPPLLYACSFALSINSYLSYAEPRSYFDALASRTMLIALDRRGSGASSRDVGDITPEAQARDIAAVADAAGLDRFTLFADIGTNMCVRFAADHPERVQGLIVWSTYQEATIIPEAPAAFRKDWSYERRLWASRMFPNGPVRLQREFSAMVKESIDAEMCARVFELYNESGDRFEALLPEVKVPTLLLERASNPRRHKAMRAAGLLPDGRFRLIEGGPPTLWPNSEPIVDAVFEFMGISEATTTTPLPSGTSVILFTDIADSAALTERMGDAAFRALSRTMDEGVRAAMRENGGTPVAGKVLGDGVMGAFTSAAQAINAARACVDLGRELPMHIGLHAGDVLSEGTNVYGGAVNIASRICGLCAPGEILVSQTVRDLARTSAGVTFEDRGEHTLKGIVDPLRVFAVRTGAV
jgi:class 3 adenylate cyclase/pimeloyl-ACP methyl ester carboxylesterase